MLAITPELIKKIHRDAIEAGSAEEQSLRDTIRDEGCLPSICYYDNHSDPFERAAYFLHRIATRHPFVEGNKRTAFLTASLIIYTDTDYMIEENRDENNNFVRQIASGALEENDIMKWFENHIIRSKI